MKKLNVVFAALSLIGIVSCSGDDDNLDTQKPAVQIISPTDHQEVPLNSTLQVKASLKDNEALASYKIEVHGAEDGHQHKPAGKQEAVEFHYEKTVTIEGSVKDFQVNEAVEIPANAKEQHYHVGIFVLDKAGNQSQQFVEIFIGEDHNH